MLKNSKKRIIYKYDVGINFIRIGKVPEGITLATELNRILNYITNLEPNEKKMDFVSEERVIYLEEYKKQIIDEKELYYAKFVSAKYNQVREVINKDTLESRGRLKNQVDGDKEINHVVFYYDKKKLTAAFEYNDFGIVNLNKIIDYLNCFIKSYFKQKGMVQYIARFECHNIVNRDFITELKELKEITTATFIVSKKSFDCTDFAEIAGRDEIKTDIAITFKRSRRNGKIPYEYIKKYYDKMDLEDSEIRKIYIEGMEENKSHVKFNTDEMKERIEMYVKLNTYGEVESNDIFLKQRKYLMEG